MTFCWLNASWFYKKSNQTQLSNTQKAILLLAEKLLNNYFSSIKFTLVLLLSFLTEVVDRTNILHHGTFSESIIRCSYGKRWWPGSLAWLVPVWSLGHIGVKNFLTCISCFSNIYPLSIYSLIHWHVDPWIYWFIFSFSRFFFASWRLKRTWFLAFSFLFLGSSKGLWLLTALLLGGSHSFLFLPLGKQI